MIQILFTLFVRGFHLANKGADLVLLGFAITIPFYLNTHIVNSNNYALIPFVIVVFSLIFVGYICSIPLLLHYKQKQESIDLKKAIGIIVNNTKRMLLPLLGLLFLLALLALLFSSNIVEFDQAGMLNKDSVARWIGMFLFSIILIFLPNYFSLENRGVFVSLWRSMRFIVQNFRFAVCIISINAVVSSGLNVLITSVDQLLFTVPMIGVSLYFSLIVSAVSLLGYQQFEF